MKHKAYSLRIAVYAFLLTLLLCPAAAAQQDRFPYGCWVRPAYDYYDQDYRHTSHVDEMYFIFKENNELLWKVRFKGELWVSKQFRFQVSGGEVRTTELYNEDQKTYERIGGQDPSDMGDYYTFRLNAGGGMVVARYYYKMVESVVKYSLDDRPSHQPAHRARPASCGEPEAPASPTGAPLSSAPSGPQVTSGATSSSATASPNPRGGAGPNAAKTPNAQTSEAASDEPEETSVNISDWTEIMPGGEHKGIIVRNNSKKRTIRVTHLQVFNCKNLAPWDCTVKDVNIVLPPGVSSSIGVIGNDVTLDNRSFSFNYKVFAKFVDDGSNKRRGGRP